MSHGIDWQGNRENFLNDHKQKGFAIIHDLSLHHEAQEISVVAGFTAT
jgi:hypothetical protein